MFNNFRSSVIIVFLLLIIPLSDSNLDVHADDSEYLNRVRKGLIYFRKVYERIQSSYVEEIDPYEFAKAGIDGMLENLDPYTVFIEQEDNTRLNIITTGKYGGLGMEIGMRNERVTIISPMDNSPAQRAGIRAGDIIQKINNVPVSELSPEEISNQLRGPIGSDVQVTIERPGFESEFTLKMVREEIVIEDVSYSDFIAPGIAYVRLTGFTEKAGQEFTREIKNLQKRDKIRGFILDLRGNSGGLLESAVDIAGIFLPKGTSVVYTKGSNDGEHSFRTDSNPLLPDIPVTVLVNNGSASASEIVAGALQDLDRAIILGTNTFGKGLVQKVYNIDKNSNIKIKITTAKYYIPSGRCVQKEDYTNRSIIFNKNKIDTLQISDEREYFTNNNRKVLEKGGITPDVYIKDDSVSYIMTELWRQSFPFNFAVQYKIDNPTWTGEFEITDEIFEKFTNYVSKHNFNYQIEGEPELNKFISIQKSNNGSIEMIKQAEALMNLLNESKKLDMEKRRDEISRVLINELAEKYFNKKEKLRYTFSFDNQLQDAIKLLNNIRQYNKILAIN
jgi:carboxyl-terminal processing protease